ncbi:signal peptidase I [Sporobacter termitidis DSM 10068]|uniref:Signal peptidase I n=1 Tax=Sporobacter termitidis DSM 10068 TaxID=1123282 RepID=A0A1M5TL88_9FIRM|nr:signal peptidase I [Sporobacter termitidis]SHH51448.1 signal peptidase I [Sporobacter termitidis DSM 10068]
MDDGELNKDTGKPTGGGDAVASRMELYDWVQCIVTAVLCGILIFVFIGRIDGIKGPSMMQTLQDGDRVILSNLFFTPKYGDIVFVKTEAYGDTPIVKRVIATGGQTIDIDFTQGVVYVDGKALQEDYTNTPTTLREDFSGPVTIPDGYVFVMGDNRNDSLDSRSGAVGLVDTRQILGKVLFVLIPGINTDGTRHWDRIGSVYK